MPEGPIVRVPLDGTRPGRATRFGAGLAILWGVVGAFAGLSGAATYIPDRVQDNLTFTKAEVLTAIAAAGAIASILGIVSGWALWRERTWAGRANLIVAATCVAIVAVLAAAMPASSPSPVPGGIGVVALLPAAAAAYGLEILLLMLARRSHVSQRAEPAAG